MKQGIIPQAKYMKDLMKKFNMAELKPASTVDVSFAAPQAHRIVNVALHREYSPGIVFIFSQGRKDIYHV
jgi:hypothetical protein